MVVRGAFSEFDRARLINEATGEESTALDMSSRTFRVGVFAAFLAVGVSEHGVASGKHEGELDQLLSFTYAFSRKVRPTIEAKLLLASANYGRLILVPQQILVSRGASPKKFDLFLYNAGKSAQTVPSLESFRAFASCAIARSRMNNQEASCAHFRRRLRTTC